MRQRLLLLLLLVSLGTGSYVYFNEIMAFIEPITTPAKQEIFKKAVKPESPAKKAKRVLPPVSSLFPSGPIAWVHSMGSGEIVRQIKKGNFFKQAVEYKIIDPSKSLSVNIAATAGNKGFFSRISSQLEEKLLLDILGKEAGLAFYPPEKVDTINFLFAAKISAIAKIQEKLNRLKDTLIGSATSISEKKYGDKTIVIYQSQELKNSFQYVIFENILLGSSSEILLKKGIDLIEGKGNNRFIDSVEFKSLFETSDLSLEGLFYLDIEKSIPIISKFIVPSEKISSIAIEDTKKELQSFKQMGLIFTIRKGLEIKSRLTVNLEKADSKLIETIGLEPRESKSLNFIPDKTIVYGTNLYDPAYFFKELTKAVGTGSIKKKAGGKIFEEFLQKSIGINLAADIIPFLGNEVFYTVFETAKSLPLPIPGIVIGFEIKNKNKIEMILKKLETNIIKSLSQKSSFQKELYKGYDIHYIPTPIGIQPGYSIINNFLLLSVNQTGIKQLIDSSKKETLLLKENKKFIAAKFPEKNNGLFFINTTLLWDNLSGSITKIPANFLTTSPKQSLESGVKFLDLMRVVQSITGSFMYEKNKIDSNVFVAVKDLPKIKTNNELLAFLEETKKKTLVPGGGGGVISKPSQVKVSHGYTYNAAGKRDPFQALVSRREIRKKKQEELERFLGALKSIKPVNLYLYNKIKKEDPGLYKKLRSYARFFKNKKTMEKLSLQAKSQKIKEYNKFIHLARTNYLDAIVGPLQQGGYKSLKLIAIIWGKFSNIALIETLDGKAHFVEINDMIGPNYGVVKKILKNKIIVVERYINYVEEISSKRKAIELPKKEEST